MKFRIDSHVLHVVTLYRPPPSAVNKLTVTQFFKEFSPWLLELTESSGDLLLVGDINFHLDIPDDSGTKRFIELLDSYNLIQHVSFPTHRSGHTLDMAVTLQDSNVLQAMAQCDMISDHNLFLCKISHPKPSPVRIVTKTRKLRNVVEQDIFKHGSPVVDASVTEMCEHYDTTLKTVLDAHAPLRTMSTTL